MSFKEDGFTLVEMMLAIGTMSIIIIPIFASFNYGYKSYIVQDQIAEMQQNLRVAMENIGQKVMMSGYKIGSQIYYDIGDGSGTQGELPAFFITNSSTTPDSIAILYVDPNGTVSLPELTLANTLLQFGSEFEIEEDLGSEPYDSWIEHYNSLPGGEQLMVVVTDGTKADLLYVTFLQDNVGGANDDIQHNPLSINGSSYQNWSMNTYQHRDKVIFWNESNAVSYRIAINSTGNPELQVRYGTTGIFQPVAENIENMQCAYIMEDGAILHDTAGEVITAMDYGNIHAIRISLVARTNTGDREWTSTGEPPLEDYAGDSTPDGYRRRRLTSVFKLRNMD